MSVLDAPQRRDYSLTGPEFTRAEERGLVNADWYLSPIDRKVLKGLTRRRNAPAIRDTVIWLLGLVALGWLAVVTFPSWWSIPILVAYGTLYCASTSRWHECGHGTAFASSWMNTAIYQLSSFMLFMLATRWRYSHIEHHSDTIIVGRDPEIHQPRPPIMRQVWLQIVDIPGVMALGPSIFQYALGRVPEGDLTFLPESEVKKACWEARVYLALYALVIAACFALWTPLPILLVGLPALYGMPFYWACSLSQHLGMYEDVLDHRLNARTVIMGPVGRFLYWNMNFHVEHHMYPMVPYHALPSLHQEIKGDLPAPTPSLAAAVKEVIVALNRQRTEPDYVIRKQLPTGAGPYRFGPYLSPESIRDSA
jgi:fatty acid desaturase